MTSTQKPVVALFKRCWLPGTETFIRNQQDAYTRYQAIAVGAQRIDSALARDEDILFYQQPGKLNQLKAKILSMTGFSLALRRALKENSVDLVHAHFGPEGFTALPACKALGIPLVVSFHGHDINEAPYHPGWRGKRYRRRLTKLFREANQLVTVSHAMREKVLALGCPPEKIVVRYTGLPIDIEELDAKPEADKVYDLIFVGRLIGIKGPLHFLQAAAQAQEKLGRPLKLALIGEGEQRTEAELLAQKLGLEASFLGHLNSAEVKEKLAQSRVFCAPSMNLKPNQLEGFGMVYLEAALAGLAVAAYAYGGVAEAVADGKTGYLAPVADIDQLAAHLVTLLSDEEAAQAMGQAGKKRAIEEFSMTRCIAQVEDLYDQLLGKKTF